VNKFFWAAMQIVDEVFEILDSIRGKPQNIAERRRLSVDIAAHMLREAAQSMSPGEKAAFDQIAKLLSDPAGMAFITTATDRFFRSCSPQKAADQIVYLLNQFGMPESLPWFRQVQLHGLRMLGPMWSRHLVPFIIGSLQKRVSQFVLYADRTQLGQQLEQYRDEGIRVDLLRAGELTISESAAQANLDQYLKDIRNSNADFISIKISLLCGCIHPMDFDDCLDILAQRLRVLYRAAIEHPLVFSDGERQSRVIILDMEDYSRFHLTVALFKKVLSEPEFHHYCGGITLQSYLPESFQIQKDLTAWAAVRVQNSGSPIQIRLVKGAYLSIEQTAASRNGWPQPTFLSCLETDANFKKMAAFGSFAENVRAAHLYIATHNIFDIAYCLLLRTENQVEPYVGFEMIKGVANPIRNVMQKMIGDMVLYCPIAKKSDFLQTVAYILRRFSEGSESENFLQHAFTLKPGSEAWEGQIKAFNGSCEEINGLSCQPRRMQNRFQLSEQIGIGFSFENEPPTDFSLVHNHRWAVQTVSSWKTPAVRCIPLNVSGKEPLDVQIEQRTDPYDSSHVLYRYALASKSHLEEALSCAHEYQKQWASVSVDGRGRLIAKAAQKLRERRSDLIGSLMTDANKIFEEADIEVSAAIDYAEYYRHQIGRMHQMKDIQWKAKGPTLVTSSWNEPCAASANGVFAALAAGCCVLLRPSLCSVLTGWVLASALWDAGIPKEALQFITCSDFLMQEQAIVDERIKAVVLTANAHMASQLLRERPALHLIGSSTGKNSLIVSAMADRDLAIREILHSAFSGNGQRDSSASIVILEAEVYDDPLFLSQLQDAASCLKTGSAWDLTTRISPLIVFNEDLLRSFIQLNEGEKWLLEPKQDPACPHLWSPGIKLGVRPGGFVHQTAGIGPFLGLMRAESLDHAIGLANSESHNLSAALISLDEREHTRWLEGIEASNYCINRGTANLLVRRQPFGGFKRSGFGNGFKTGGPNFLRDFMHASSIGLPQEKFPVNEAVNQLTIFMNKISLTAEQLGILFASIANYAYWWKRLRQNRDPNKIIGEDNFFRYVPRKNMAIRIETHSPPLDVLRICAAALTVGCGLEISWQHPASNPHEPMWCELAPLIAVVEETLDDFLQRVRTGRFDRIRSAEPASTFLLEAAAQMAIPIVDAPVVANGRLELLHYLREISISTEYHRYGYLGARENELRKPIL
jgi:RHH-type proline utilization regulon transcriptional repressor/proline dehydrogenase/delta 1-pyrroline-5-carboxylate dehydrogenase